MVVENLSKQKIVIKKNRLKRSEEVNYFVKSTASEFLFLRWKDARVFAVYYGDVENMRQNRLVL